MREYLESYAAEDGTVFRNSNPAGYTSKGESGIVPLSGVVELDEVIAANSVLTITVDAAPMTIKPWGFSVAPGECAVDRERGKIAFNVGAQGGGAALVNYVPAGSRLTAAKIPSVLAPAPAWGGIEGTLADQTDLQSALDDKADVSHTHGISDITDLQGELDNLAADLGLKQDADSDLTAIAGLSSTGLIARTGSGTAAVRTITGTANEITVTNGNGVSGNPTLAAHANLARLATVQTWSAQQNFGRIGITGFVAGHREVQATGNITAADYRLGINVGANITLTLPLASSVEVGTTFEIYNLQTSASYNTTISTATGSDYLVWDTNVLNNFTFNRDITGVLVIQKYFTGAWAVIRCY